MPFPPDLFIIGAQRSGTTFLADLLSQHPRIVLSKPKEPAFFTVHYSRGLGWYRDRFDGPEDGVFVDATTWYSVAPTANYPVTRRNADESFVAVPERISGSNPRAKFVYVVREPLARTYSAYWLLRRFFLERREFQEAVTVNPFYVRSSDYSGQIDNYLEFFPPDQFKIIVFEDMIKAPVRAVAEVLAFAGVDPAGCTFSMRKAERNEAFRYRRIVERLGAWPGASRIEYLRRGIAKAFPARVARTFDRLLVAPIPRMSDGDRRLLVDLLAGANRGLTALMKGARPAWHNEIRHSNDGNPS